jgi:HEAT repeat protein
MERDDFPVSSTATEQIRLVEDIMQELQKAKKQMRMYPPNNPIYVKASKTLHDKFNNFFDLQQELALEIDKYEITYKKEQVYCNQDKIDNLALFFFKDGIRLIFFKKGITREELQDFIRILNVDFETEALDDDIVTMLWERDFEHIKSVVDENFLSDWEIPEKDKVSDTAIQSAHAAGLRGETANPNIAIHMDESDYAYFESEIERQNQPKIQKVITILFESLTHSHDPEDIKRIAGFIKDTLYFCIEHGDFYNASHALDLLEEFKSGPAKDRVTPDMFNDIYDAINGEEFTNEILKVLESDIDVDSSHFSSYTNHLNQSVIPYFMHILGELQKIKNRRFLIDTLSKIGRNNVHALAKGLNGTKWYVARNTALILGSIATRDTIPYLVESLPHEDQRVRKEVVNALGNTGSPEVIEHIKQSFNDPNFHVRNAAAKAMGTIKTDDARQLLLKEISAKDFLLKDLNEKKEFFTALANWPDQEVKDFLIKILNSSRILKKAKNDENRACAAYAIGLVRDKDAVPALEKACKSANLNLRRFASDALRKLKD